MAPARSELATEPCQSSHEVSGELPEPDAAIVPAGNYDHAHPIAALLVIEVADSSLARDRRKAGLSAAAGIRSAGSST